MMSSIVVAAATSISRSQPSATAGEITASNWIASNPGAVKMVAATATHDAEVARIRSMMPGIIASPARPPATIADDAPPGEEVTIGQNHSWID